MSADTNCSIYGNRETIFTCPHTLKFRTRPLAGTASGLASDSVRGRDPFMFIFSNFTVAPEVRLPNKRIGQDTGKETILECVIAANPIDKRVWLRDGVQIANSHKYRLETYDEGDNTVTLSLKIKLLEDEDFGRYTCFASNDLGSDKESMVLYGECAYSVRVVGVSSKTWICFLS